VEDHRSTATNLLARAQRLVAEASALTTDLAHLVDQAAAPPERTVTPTLLTADQAAEALAVGRSTVFRLMATGELGSVKIGSLRRVPVVAVEAYVAGLDQAAG